MVSMTDKDWRGVKTTTQGQPAPAAGAPKGGARILVADDEHLIAMGTANALKALGHEVIGVANDGEAAVSMARDLKPELAVLDIRMPKLTGIEAARTIYEELRIPALIISAYSDQEYLLRIQAFGTSSGVYGYLLKPVGHDELRVAIEVARHRSDVDDLRSGRIDQLEKNLSNRRMVEQAKWKLVERLQITEAVAHERLQRVARNRRRPLAEVAQGVLEQDDLLQ